VINIKNAVKIEAINILCHTIISDGLTINSPRIAVKPAINTKKWR
jgi:hypothetical protein